MFKFTDVRKRWFAYGIAFIVAVTFGSDAASALLNAISMLAPAL